ncbi:hypothetical protein V6Z12_D11G386400 [Gossypium hirsutum]
MTESIKIIQQALEGIPSGPYENLEIRCFDRERDPEWNDFEYRFISFINLQILPQLVKRMKLADIMRILVEDINSFYTLESLKEIYGIIWMLVPILTLVLGITIGVLVIVWLEREISAAIQQRIGPEYADPLGILQALADGTKLLFKENILPSRGNTRLFSIGPAIAVISILLSFSVIPFSSRLILADLNIGIFLWIAISSIAPVGLLMSGYGSNNKYSFLGGLYVRFVMKYH